jgi:hypothetical protein
VPGNCIPNCLGEFGFSRANVPGKDYKPWTMKDGVDQ